jgi:HlyD family secretion protein
MKARTALLVLIFLAACHRGSEETVAQGYIEGEYLNVAPAVTARITQVLPETGEWVRAGTPIVTLDRTDAVAMRDQAVAQIAGAEAALAQAESSLRTTTAEYQRQTDLLARRVSAQATFDVAKQAYETSAAQVTAAQRNIDSAKAVFAGAEWQLAERTVLAPGSGPVDDIFLRPGEVATAGRPVLSILPPENRKVRFFVAEADLPRLALGTQVFIRCDGCADQIPALVTFIATEAEYTPPVIYSLETRGKLVFKIEARPIDGKVNLRVGLPVDVLLPDKTRAKS